MTNGEAMTKSLIDRRNFLKGALATGAIAVSGAALTACASKDADTISEPGSDSPEESPHYSFETPPDPITDFAEELEFDVVVVGAGTAGLITALSAQQSGLKVAVVTASAFAIGRGGSLCIPYSKYKEELGLPRTPIENYKREIAQYLTCVDQMKWYKYYNRSEESINWLIDIMEAEGWAVALENNTGMKQDSLYYQPLAAHGFYLPDEGTDGKIGMMQHEVVKTLAKKLEAEGGVIYYSNVGKQLVRENDNIGRVTACITQREDGSYTKYTGTKAVVLATGDFTKDREMVAKYCSWYVGRIPDKSYTDVTPVDYDITLSPWGLYSGDGHKMGLWVGAAWQKNQPNAVMDGRFMPGPHRIGYQSCWSLLLNKNGQRYMDEYCSCILSVVTSALQPDGEHWAFWTPEYLDFAGDVLLPANCAYGMTAVPTRDEQIAYWDSKVDDFRCFKADTIEELLEKTGLPKEASLASIDNYNQICKAGVDTEFYKDSSMLIPVSEGPFYAQVNVPPEEDFCPLVLGGLRTDPDMRVCDANDNPIPGLYNVGTMIGDFYMGYYTFHACGVNYGATCVTFGYLTGKYIAENE